MYSIITSGSGRSYFSVGWNTASIFIDGNQPEQVLCTFA